MEDRLRELSERLAGERGGRTGRGMRYSAELRDDVVAAARSGQAAGLHAGSIARHLGIRAETLRRWLGGGEGSRGFRVVHVRRHRGVEGVVLVSPGGYRVEGLGLGDAATLLRLLG